VVTPIAADQPDNAKAGAGIEVPEPDSAAIRTALTSVLSDPRFATRARDTAEEM
jgi:UDP:flavonoid glycosyltransferase YjiC (YdhE family)